MYDNSLSSESFQRIVDHPTASQVNIMRVLENKVPPLVVAFLSALIMKLIATPGHVAIMNDPLRVIAAAGTLFVGIFFAVAGVMTFRKAKTTLDPRYPGKASLVVSSGIYGVSRNPMYLGIAFMLVAFAIYLASALSLAGVLVFIVYMNRFQIIPEERAMKEKFGSDYENYLKKVRRWL